MAIGALGYAACSDAGGDGSTLGGGGSGGGATAGGSGGGGGDVTDGGAGTGGGASDGGGFFDTGLTGDGQINPDSSCADLTLQAEAVPLDMYFMVDTSGSMFGTNIDALKSGLTNFFNDPQSAGLGAAAQEFPIPLENDPYDETCDQNAYAKPSVPWAPLPNPALVSWIQTLNDDGYTPTMPALTGAVQACQDRIAVQPTHKCAVVFVTDGRPEGGCPPTGSSAQGPLGNVAAGAWAEGIPVFAIGFPGLDSIGEEVIATIAQQGGTTAPIIIQSGNVGQEFIDALMDIRGTALGCEYQMPTAEAGVVNPNLVKVTYTPGGATEPQEIPRVDGPAECGAGDGWYYDDNANPSKLTMCPATCDKMQEDDEGEVQILLGCIDNQT
ncbi:MAG: vWA domain-containing protein [Myxococcota bacterium]